VGKTWSALACSAPTDVLDDVASFLCWTAGATVSCCSTVVFARSFEQNFEQNFEAVERTASVPRAACDALSAAFISRESFTFRATSVTIGTSVSSVATTRYTGSSSPSSSKRDAICVISTNESNCNSTHALKHSRTRALSIADSTVARPGTYHHKLYVLIDRADVRPHEI
jgi:hypothetical protein